MTTGLINAPGTPAMAANAAVSGPSITGAPKKALGPATVLLHDIANSPSLVTATDLLPLSPLTGKDGNGNINSTNGMKRPRPDDYAGLEKETRDVDIRSAPTDCRDQVTLALNKDRRIHEAKMTMFQDCADAIDKTLQRAGTELYPYAKEFSIFFAGCLSEWLGTQRSPSQTTGTPGLKRRAEKPTYARVVPSSAGGYPPALENHQVVGGQTTTPVVARPTTKKPNGDLRIFIRIDNTRLEPYSIKSTLIRRSSLNYKELRGVTRCASGSTLHPRDEVTQKKLLAFRGEIIDILKAKDVEKHVVWYHYKVQGCPRRVMTTEGLTIEITNSIVADEVEAQTGVRPVRCIISKSASDNDIETIWLVSCN